MQSMLPFVLIVLSVFALFGALFALWQSLRVLFGVDEANWANEYYTQKAEELVRQRLAGRNYTTVDKNQSSALEMNKERFVCEDCGSDNEEDAIFCKKCGTRLVNDPAVLSDKDGKNA